MSWAAHQFEGYALMAHLPKRWKGRVSYLAIVAGDQTPDFIAKFWTYGFTVNGRHYGASEPFRFHRGWPGAGFSHSLAFGLLLAGILWLVGRNRPWQRAWVGGFVLGFAAHVLVDINDTVGTMLLFPFSTLNFSVGTWAYAATVGKYEDAAAYYSSLGFVMDALWLVAVLVSWRCLTRDFWRTQVVAADPWPWSWLARRFSEPVLLALYRATFFYGLFRMVAWTTWAHLLTDGHPWDLTWGGPRWIPQVQLSHPPRLVALAVAVALGVLCWFVVDRVVAPRQRDEEPAEVSPG